MISALSAVPARADAVHDQLDSAVAAVRDNGGRCRRSVMPELERVRDELDDGDLGRVAHHVEKIKHHAEHWCGREVIRALHHLHDALAGDGDGDGDGDGPPPPRTITVDSRVDLGCMQAFKERYPYEVDQTVLDGWLATCRTGGYAAGSCSATSSEPTPACEAAVAGIYPYQMTDDVRADIARACQTEHCTLAAAGSQVRTKVDLACFGQRKSSYPYAADADHIVSWLTGCRNTLPAGSCQITRSVYDGACFRAAASAYTYQLDQNVIQRFMTECKTVENQCQ